MVFENNWACNEQINGNPVVREIEEIETKSVLGLRWLPVPDVFTYKLLQFENNDEWTKRKVLSCIGKLYDPNGFIPPIVIVAKIIIQDLWRFEKYWDEPLSTKLSLKWNEFLKALPALEHIKIPRWLDTKRTRKTTIHGFTDASELAYAAVVYLRVEHEDGSISVILLQSKTRVAPLKHQSIPRLELCAAHLLAKLVHTILSQLEHDISGGHLWTDSEDALQWIWKEPGILKTVVGSVFF